MKSKCTIAGLALLLATAGCTASDSGDSGADDVGAEEGQTASSESPADGGGDRLASGLFPGFDIDPDQADALTGDVETAFADEVDWDVTSIELEHIGDGVYLGEVAYSDGGNALTISCLVSIAEGSSAGDISFAGHMCPAPTPTG